MITLNDYLYSGNTVLKILLQYSSDLKKEAIRTGNAIDLAHSNFLMQIIELLEHTDFLLEVDLIYMVLLYMTEKYPFLAFTFKGRIKSLIRAEEKFNGYILEYIYDYYKANSEFPSENQIKNSLNCFRDLIAYRIVISLPKCHIKEGESREEKELDYLYKIAEDLPDFIEQKGFTPQLSGHTYDELSNRLSDRCRAYYRDYVIKPRSAGYRSLHITFYDNLTRCYTEVQLRTKDMDDYAEIGDANHFGYEKSQEVNRTRRDIIRPGECRYFDDAYERLIKLLELDLSALDVNMFRAFNNQLINDGCGLFRGRQILPFEHLSRFQNDINM